MIWKDCFERELFPGEDVVVGILEDSGRVELHSGIILEINEGEVLLTYNGWNPSGSEYTVEKYYLKEDYPTGVIKDIFRIFSVTDNDD